jgi:hypothetical protein
MFHPANFNLLIHINEVLSSFSKLLSTRKWSDGIAGREMLQHMSQLAHT